MWRMSTQTPAKPSPTLIQRVYLTLTLLNTLAASFIWGINTLFLLDAGLTNTQAFLANAFFTVGQVIFEVPTGIVADMKGRRTSYLLGTLTLALSTFAYLGAWMIQGPFWMWVVASIMLGLGFTFFSGATEAWLVDSLNYADFKGNLDAVFGRAQSVSGVAMLTGSVAGGLVAQASNLGVPYWLRIGLLLATLVVAAIYMRDWGFTPERGASISADMRQLFKTSIDLGLRKPRVRWVMLAAPFASGVGIYVFYAMQPHLLNLYGDQAAYGVAGLAAAIVAGAQIVGGILGPALRQRVARRTSALLIGAVLSAAMLLLISQIATFWLAIVVLSIWGLIFAAVMPIRQAYLNGLIPSKQRATVLSFDALMGSSGGAVFQPVLGRAADAGGYPFSFMVGGLIQAVAIPLIGLAHRENLRHATDEDQEAG